MAFEYTKTQLDSMNKELMIQLFLNQQEQLKSMDQKLQLILEQLAVSNRKQFGRSSEKLEIENQIAFMEVNGELVFFNEAEALLDLEGLDKEETPAIKPKKRSGKRQEDIKDLPIIEIEHKLTEVELIEEFGEKGWKQLPDEIYKRYKFTPAKLEIEEHHVGVYASKKENRIRKADHPGYLFRNSLVSASLEAAIINGKYINAVPLYRQEKEFERYGAAITRQNMASWTIRCAEQYLSILYDYMHEQIYRYPVIQADETPVRVNKDGRTAGAKSYMWVYRSSGLYNDKPMVLYEYQKTRNSSHPREFMKEFTGVCVTDGYEVYHSLARERQDLTIAGCWAHARRKFDEALKALPKAEQNKSLAYLALKQIQAIYRVENQLKELPAEERLRVRQVSVKPLVDGYFVWVRQNSTQILGKSKTWKGLQYSLNQEQYLRVFLDNGEVPIDNNSAEQSIRSFCIGKKNWMFIDTVSGAQASAIIYSIAETAKANNLKPYEYFKHLLTEIQKHMEDKNTDFCERLLPWSPELPEECRKPDKK